MTPVLVAVTLSLLAAALVIVVAGSAQGRRRGRHFLRDLRGGLRRPAGGPYGGVLAGARREMAEVADADGSGVDEIFELGTQPASAYVRPEDLTDSVTRVAQRAARGVRTLAQPLSR